MDLFLGWCEKHRAARTYDWYRNRCQGFLETIPATLAAYDLKPFHVQEWVDSHHWDDGMKRGAITTLCRTDDLGASASRR